VTRQSYGADTQLITLLAGQPYGGVGVTFWTTGPSTSGGTQITDLLNATGGVPAGGIINSNTDGSMPPFSGPAAGTTSMWAQAGNANERCLIYALSALAGGGGGGGVTLSPTPVKTANYSVNVGELARMSAAAASRVVTLPTTVGNDGAEVGAEVVAITLGNTVALQCAGSDTFEDGSTVKILGALDEAMILQATASGGTWNILSDSPRLVGVPAVQCVASTNHALSGVPGAIDGYTALAGDTILLPAQTTGSQNGPWVVSAGTWVRPWWFPTLTLATVFQVVVRNGSVNAGTTWSLTGGAVTIDSTTQNWINPNLLVVNDLADVLSPASSLSNLGAGALATVSPGGSPSTSTWLRGDANWEEIPTLFLFSGGDAPIIEASGAYPPTAYALGTFVCELSTVGAPSGSALTVVLQYNSGSGWTNIQSLTISAGSTTAVTATATVTVPAGSQIRTNWTSVGSGTPAAGAVFSASAT